MRVFVSSDMEGTAGIVDWSQCRGPGPSYEEGCRLLLAEVNAAIEGGEEGGATDFLVNDSHGAMSNLQAGGLGCRAAYLSGRHKPGYMMEGIDSRHDAAMFISYHGSMGSNGVLSHTYNPRAVYEVTLNGIVTGEAGINALVALAHEVPVALVTGDQVTLEEAQPFLPDAVSVCVKTAVTRFAASSLHPEDACGRIRKGAAKAMEKVSRHDVRLPRIDLPARLEVAWLTADMAELATSVRGVERAGGRSVTIESSDPLALYRSFVACIAITRSILD